MRLYFHREQLIRSSEQLVLVDTKGFLGPGALFNRVWPMALK